MKMLKRSLALLLCFALVLGMATTVFAQTVGTAAEGTGTITVQNAAKGETYKLVKLFGATVTGKENGSIAYTGTIPDALADYFEEDTAGNITVKDAAKNANGELTKNAIDAITAWAKIQDAVASVVSDGSTLKFVGLHYGYYVVLSSQGSAISVDSTNPNAVIVDKNTTEPALTKTVDDDDVYIGQRVTYTVEASTANYLKNDNGEYEIVTHYVIDDTLPAFLTDVEVTSVTVGGVEYKVEGAVPHFAEVEYVVGDNTYTYENAIVIPWATWEEKEDGSYEYDSIYNNGAEIVITYEATVTDEAEVDGKTGNINVVTLTPYTTPDTTTPPPPPDNPPPTPPTPDPWEEHWEDKEVVFTYATALKKVDENKNPLAGAKFKAKGLVVEGSKGKYTVVSYDAASTTLSTEMETDDQGNLVILGIPSKVDEKVEVPVTFFLTLVETEAPAGYNKLTEEIKVETQVIGEVVTASSSKIYYDAEGKVTEEVTESYTEIVDYTDDLEAKAIKVVNNKGLELPNTGGMGTTLFYIIGSVLVAAAVVLLVTKKRMHSAQ